VLLVGDTGVLIELGGTIDPEVNARVLALAAHLRKLGLAGVRDVVPTYASVLVHLDPDTADQEAIAVTASSLAARAGAPAPEGRAWRVPVAYGGEHGVDLAEMAGEKAISEAELVRRHIAPTYRVYMIGFQPGFAYLGGLDPTLTRSRRTDPRPRIPASSVSIGGVQTAVASVEAPSGWNLIGRTPALLFCPGRDPVFLFQAGDTIRFEVISGDVFLALAARAATGELIAERLR
jgi:KipI family sensor histidine kinase inhibitor